MLNLAKYFRPPALVTLAVLFMANGGATAREPLTVEVFTTTGFPVVTDNNNPDQGAVSVDVYEIDAVDRFETDLSQGLPASPEAAKRIALERISRLDEKRMQRFQRAALGLAKAAQYGLDRVPAMVFDSQVVVYGITYVGEGLDRHHRWQGGSAR